MSNSDRALTTILEAAGSVLRTNKNTGIENSNANQRIKNVTQGFSDYPSLPEKLYIFREKFCATWSLDLDSLIIVLS